MAAMPRACDVAGSMCGTSRPPTRSVPASGRSAPVMTLISVDLPAPFSPHSACTSPARRSNETPSSALTPGKCLVIDRSSSSATGGEAGRLLGFLVDVLALVVAVLDDGGVEVRLVDRDRVQQDARHVLPAVVDRARRLGDRFLLRELHREVGGLGGERLDRLVDRHGLAAGHDALAG